MRITLSRKAAAAALLWAAVLGAHPKAGKARVVQSHALPRLDGGHLQVRLVEVKYGPGERSEVHTHPCPVSGYVVEGAVRMQVKGEAEAVYRAGESFYEEPNGVHLISANASAKEPARFLAYFVCDHDAPLSGPVGGRQ